VATACGADPSPGRPTHSLYNVENPQAGVSMSWLDRVIAVPTIGVRFRPWFKSVDHYVAALEPMFEELEPNGTAEVQGQVASISFNTKRGLSGKVDSEDIIVNFSYRPVVKENPGAVPFLDYRGPVERYTELLENVEELMGTVCRALLKAPRQVMRIGVVAEARLDRRSPPPGVDKFVAHLGRPWQNGLSEYNANVSAVLDRGDGAFTRCHHTTVFQEAQENDVLQLKLDWQRVFEPKREYEAERLIQEVAAARASALDYFESFGRGDLRYEV